MLNATKFTKEGEIKITVNDNRVLFNIISPTCLFYIYNDGTVEKKIVIE